MRLCKLLEFKAMHRQIFLVLLAALLLTVDSIPREKKAGSEPASNKAALNVAPGLDQRLAKFRRITMPYHSANLTARELQMVLKLVDASRYLEDIFWRQSDPDGFDLYQSLAGSKDPIELKVRHYLWINASRFDLIDENKPFVGAEPLPPGRGYYPKGLTREQAEKYVKDHPEQKSEIYSPYTVVRWHGDELRGVPYHVAYKSFLEPAAKDLREAARLSSDAAFANFLRLRADALLSDDYFKSDLAWMDLKDPKFDVIFAPYETYLDDLLGIKTSYGAAVLIRNDEESKKLALFQKYVPDIQEALPLSKDDLPSKRGLQTPMEVMDAPYRAADLRHGYQAVADNLPNDPRIHEQKGSKKIFFKNFMDARVSNVILPLAQIMMRADQAPKVSGEGYLYSTIMHEMCHGLGPAFARTSAGKVDIREAIGPQYGGLEEAKADVCGMYGLKWLVDHEALPKDKLEEYYASYVGGLFRTLRFGTGEAHGQAEMMEFNYISEHGGIKREISGKYAVVYDKMPDALASLCKELLEIEATGDRARAEKWFKKYDVMPVTLVAALKKASKVPVDVDPVFAFKEKLE
jgi:hypothetical protein